MSGLETRAHKVDTVKQNASAKGIAKFWWMMGGLAALLLVMFLSISMGFARINLSTIWESMVHFDSSSTDHQIIRDVRFPRTIASALTGAFLAISGSIMQGMTRNPLGDPSILGVTSGAAFAIAVSFAFLPDLTTPALMVAAFVGALLGASMVFGAGALSRGGLTPVKLVLAGAAVSALLTSLSTAIAIHFDVAKEMNFWFAGSFSSVKWAYVYPLMMTGVITFAIVMIMARSITVLSLGEEVSKGLGQRTFLIKVIGAAVILVMTGMSVAVAGVISFLGLIVPHMARILIGVDYRFIIPFSGILGAILLVAADIGARMINPPFETPVGAITTLLGGPFFLYLARREGSKV
ncbi:MAG: iron ABC transporter permease [Bacillaceae bacterium]|nr:iron ABC transporter permease [Bacillaceae bacterium]